MYVIWQLNVERNLRGAKCLDEISVPASIIELRPEDLVIVSQLEPTTNVIRIMVYEREHFLVIPNPSANQELIAQFSICLSCFTQTVAEILDMYTGWSKIDKTQPTKLIGIHNQDPNTLYIQFSLDQRYFVYERCLGLNREMVNEELFGKKHNFRQRALCSDDEQYLISKLRFMPKTKKAISFYPQKASIRLAHTRSLLSLPCFC
jgi:hypothetical protein